MYIYTFDIKIGTAEVYDTYIMDYGGPVAAIKMWLREDVHDGL